MNADKEAGQADNAGGSNIYYKLLRRSLREGRDKRTKSKGFEGSSLSNTVGPIFSFLRNNRHAQWTNVSHPTSIVKLSCGTSPLLYEVTKCQSLTGSKLVFGQDLLIDLIYRVFLSGTACSLHSPGVSRLSMPSLSYRTFLSVFVPDHYARCSSPNCSGVTVSQMTPFGRRGPAQALLVRTW